MAGDGLVITGGDTTVQGLAIDNFRGVGINLLVLGNNTITGNYVGINPAGTLAAGNGEGIVVQSDGNVIGLPSGKNVISGNSLNGVRVTGGTGISADRNSISNNLIGTDATGEIAVNNGVGVTLDNISNTLVNANVISGNSGDGIDLVNSLGSFNTLQANRIGVNLGGTLALGNGGNGISISNSGGTLVHDSVSNTDSVVRGILIGGMHANGNIISANADGVALNHGTYVTIAGNNIGTDSTGATSTDANAASLGNAGNGVNLSTGSHDITVGGTSSDLRNVIDGGFGNGMQISTGATANNLITGNYIGADESGTVALGGYGSGVYITSAGSTISGNLISGSAGGAGIYLLAAATVQGNLIGTQADGVSALPNNTDGIYVASNGSLIRGGAGQGNVIAFNAVNGINIKSGVQNSIRGNSIFGNTALGIDLGGDGVTANGPVNTTRTGANTLLNHPVLSTAIHSISTPSTTVSGSFAGLASTTYTIEFFSNNVADPSGSGQGKTYLGSTTVTTNSAGNGSFSATVAALPGGQPFVTSTATDAAGNTSEFSNAVQVMVGAPQATTRTQLTSSAATVTIGTPVIFTATVMRSGSTTPGGTVTFHEVFSGGGTSNLGTVAFTGGPVSISVSTLSIGTHNIIAVYSGDANYSTSTSDPLVETIKSNTATINGNTFRDTTGDGLSSDDGAMAGVTINLYRDTNNNGTLDGGDGAPVAHLVTNSTGGYSFGNLPAGRYFVQEVTPTGYIRTAPALSTYYTVNSTAGTVYSGRDFDNYMMCNDRQFVSGISYSVNGNNSWFADLRGHIHEGDTVKVRFTVAINHTATLTLVSYTAPGSSFDANKASLQAVYQFATGIFTAGYHTMQVTIPRCYFQVDFVCGDYIDRFGPAGSNVFYSAQNRLISADNGGIHAQLLSLLGATDDSSLNT